MNSKQEYLNVEHSHAFDLYDVVEMPERNNSKAVHKLHIKNIYPMQKYNVMNSLKRQARIPNSIENV